MAATAPDSHDGTDAPRELPGSRRARPSAEHETGCPLELELTQFRAQVEAFAAAGVVSAWVDPRTPHPAGDHGHHKQMIDPVAETGQAARASSAPFVATNGMEPDDARCVSASNVLRDEHEIVDRKAAAVAPTTAASSARVWRASERLEMASLTRTAETRQLAIGGRANAPCRHLFVSCPGPPTVGSRLRWSCRV